MCGWWMALNVTRRGARITVAVDDQQVLDFTDSKPLGAGGVGLDSSFSVSRWWDPVITGTAIARYRWEEQNYHKSAQFMIFEFLDFCRAAGIEPVANPGEHLPAEEVAAFVEYCNGDASTAGGRQRIADGHPTAYGLRHIMYGNGLPPIEQAVRLSDLLAKIDPQVRLILGDIGPTPWFLLSRLDPPRAVRLTRFLDRLEAVSSRPEVALLGSHRLWDQTLDEAQAGFPSPGKSARLYAAETNGSACNWHPA
jgi:hypothetical protein